MSDGLNIGKTWTVNVPAGSTRTVSPNLWQYSLFPYSTSPSIMYPSDGLSVMNDTQLFNFDYGVTSFMDTSANMFYQFMPMMKQWMAQQAEMYQKIMTNLHSNTNINVTNPENDDETKIDGTKAIDKEKIETVLNKIAKNPNHKDNFNKEITFTNKDGNEEKTTLLRRLIDLSKQYIDDKSTAEISEENFEILWDIAGKYAKTGKLSSSDYDKLVEIAQKPGGPGAYVKPADDKKKDKNEKTGVRPEKNKEVLNSNEYTTIAENFKKALYHWGTTRELLYSSSRKLNEYNILEVYNEFYESYGIEEGENLVDAIFDDCDGWGTGERNTWLGTRFGSTNDAQPHIERIDKALIARAERFAQNNPEVAAKYGYLKEVEKPTDEQKKGLIEVGGKYYDPEQLNIASSLIDSSTRETTSSNIQNFVEKLAKAEKEAYKED